MTNRRNEAPHRNLGTCVRRKKFLPDSSMEDFCAPRLSTSTLLHRRERMSNSTKRDVATAFEGEAVHNKSKRKRVRGNTEPQSVNASSVPTTPRSALPKVPKTTKLEDRTSTPTKSEANAIQRTSIDKESTKSKKKRHRPSKTSSENQTVQKKQKRDSHKWSISSATGGIFVDHDPILTVDGDHLLLPTKDHVNVYALATSLLVRSIPIKEKDEIVSCLISTSHATNLLVTTRRGNLVKIDWSNGAIKGRWRIGRGFNDIASLSSDESRESLLAVRSTEAQGDQLLLVSFARESKMESKVLFQADDLQKVLVASSDASTIVVHGNKAMYVGLRRSVGDSEYTWYKQPAPANISSADARIQKRVKSKNKTSTSVDIVVGLENGAIYLYEDILSQLVESAKKGHREDVNGRRLHWHRNSVRSVKWSKDGNYVVSGGDETVLVIWQLETNQQQFLPHLSTSILNITISSTGAEYALRLGDNSVMVLPTADLLPSANVTGLALATNCDEIHPMQLHPLHSNQLLATVSTRSARKDSHNAATHLQTYDIDTNLQLNKQALTRNLTTTVNVSPYGQQLHEPSVAHLQVSTDGNWLATVDEWSPSSSDVKAMYLKDEESTEQQEITETVLRIWSWNADDNSWDLSNRIDTPHVTSKSSVLGLASNPSRSEFATMGEDGWVKFWHPRKRVRDGVQVRNSAGQPLFNWTCARSVLVEKPRSTSQQSAGSLAYSDDGSLLAVSWSVKQRHVHIVDTTTGKLSMSLPNLLSEGHAALAVLGRYLVCLSSSLKLFDTITLQTTFTIDLEQHSNSFLAVNNRTKVFAIGLNRPDRSIEGIISVFDVENMEKGSVNDFELSRKIYCVLAEPMGQGFVVVDDDCSIRRIVPPVSVSSASRTVMRAPVVESTNMNGALDNVFGRERSALSRAEGQKMIEDVQTSRNLADLFSATSTAAQPGVRELFDQIAKAVSGTQVQTGA